MQENYEYIKELLRKKNLKATSSRVQLLSQMYNLESAIPYSSIQKIMSAHDRVTIYRTLETLSDKGVIHKAYQDENDIYYAVCGSKCDHIQHRHNHIHFKCISCGKVTCNSHGSEIKINLPNHQVLDISIHVKGVCSVCSTS